MTFLPLAPSGNISDETCLYDNPLLGSPHFEYGVQVRIAHRRMAVEASSAGNNHLDGWQRHGAFLGQFPGVQGRQRHSLSLLGLQARGTAKLCGPVGHRGKDSKEARADPESLTSRAFVSLRRVGLLASRILVFSCQGVEGGGKSALS